MDKREMLELRLTGLTYEEIAKRANVSRQRVQQIVSPPIAIRDFVVSKFKGKCNRCGLIVGKSGNVHHNGDEVDTYNDIENLELLCIACHRTAHKEVNMEKGKPVNIRGLDRNLWKLAKTEAVKADKTIAEWLGEAIKEKLERGGKVK